MHQRIYIEACERRAGIRPAVHGAQVRAHAEAVARYAQGVIENDKAARRKLYEQLNLPPDPSVK